MPDNCTCGGIWRMDPKHLRELADLRERAEYEHSEARTARLSEMWDKPTIGHYRRLALANT